MAVLVAGVMHMEFAGQGWQEKWFFDASITDPVLAKPYMKQIVWGRSAFFGQGVTCTYARVSRIGLPPDKEVVELPYPVGPHPTWSGGAGAGDTLGPPNDPRTAIFQVFQGVGGRWANRYFRGCPDDWVRNNVLQPGILDYLIPAADTGSDPDLSPGGGIGSHLGVCKAFWRFLMRRVVMGHKVTNNNYTAGAYNGVVFRKIGSKKVGRPFGLQAGKRPTTTIAKPA